MRIKIFHFILLFFILSCGDDNEPLIVDTPLDFEERIELIFGTYTGTSRTFSSLGESMLTRVPYTVEDYPKSKDSIYIIGQDRRRVFIDSSFSFRQEFGGNAHYTYSFSDDTLRVSSDSGGNAFFSSFSYTGIKN